MKGSNMEQHEETAEVIELGIASEVTRGGGLVYKDTSGDLQNHISGILAD
jgi:hypothetical protein